MVEPALRPLSLGEILDRTFSLYRRHFLLFVGISAVPHLLILSLNLWRVVVRKAPAVATRGPFGILLHPASQPPRILALGLMWGLVALLVYLFDYLFSQGGTSYAVSELYLGRDATVGESLRRVWGQLGSLFGVLMLNGIAVMGALIFLIIPGIYVACRLITCVPVALLEDLGPRESLERGFFLTKDNAGRAFVIYLLYFVIYFLVIYATTFLIFLPLAIALDPNLVRLVGGLIQVAGFAIGVLVQPILLIATSVFYYDLRARKEALYQQLKMNPSGNIPGTSRIPSMLS